jgi:hypothetical protein
MAAMKEVLVLTDEADCNVASDDQLDELGQRVTRWRLKEIRNQRVGGSVSQFGSEPVGQSVSVPVNQFSALLFFLRMGAFSCIPAFLCSMPVSGHSENVAQLFLTCAHIGGMSSIRFFYSSDLPETFFLDRGRPYRGWLACRNYLPNELNDIATEENSRNSCLSTVTKGTFRSIAVAINSQS